VFKLVIESADGAASEWKSQPSRPVWYTNDMDAPSRAHRCCCCACHAKLTSKRQTLGRWLTRMCVHGGDRTFVWGRTEEGEARRRCVRPGLEIARKWTPGSPNPPPPPHVALLDVFPRWPAFGPRDPARGGRVRLRPSLTRSLPCGWGHA
jgi:hypothetical protein